MKTRKAEPNDWTQDYSIERDHKSYSEEPMKTRKAKLIDNPERRLVGLYGVKVEPQHTPTPWILGHNEANWFSEIRSPEMTIAQCEGTVQQAEANAEMIVRAVNTVSNLNTYLEEKMGSMSAGNFSRNDVEAMLNHVRQAIAKAEQR